jgi:hypothetical protein
MGIRSIRAKPYTAGDARTKIEFLFRIDRTDRQQYYETMRRDEWRQPRTLPTSYASGGTARCDLDGLSALDGCAVCDAHKLAFDVKST